MEVKKSVFRIQNLAIRLFKKTALSLTYFMYLTTMLTCVIYTVRHNEEYSEFPTVVDKKKTSGFSS